jgi:hypothetical protein
MQQAEAQLTLGGSDAAPVSRKKNSKWAAK